MLTTQLHVPWPEDHPLPEGGHFLDESRRRIGFDSMKQQEALASLTSFGGDGAKLKGELGQYNPDISSREFGRYVPYELGYGIHKAPEIRTSMRRFVVDDDFTHGNTSQRAYEVDAIVALNNRPRHFSVPADKYARSALVRAPHRSQTQGFTPEEAALLRKSITGHQPHVTTEPRLPVDEYDVRPWDLTKTQTGIPHPRIADQSDAGNELGPIGHFETELPLAPPTHKLGVVGNEEPPFGRFEQGAGGLYGLGPEFVTAYSGPAKTAGPDPDEATRKAIREELRELEEQNRHLTAVRDGYLLSMPRKVQRPMRVPNMTAEELGISPKFNFGKRVYQCLVKGAGIGYRRTPKYENKNPDGCGPVYPEVIIANDICQGPRGIFLRCTSGHGWLPLYDPNGNKCFEHLGTVEEVGDLEERGLLLADGRKKV